MEAATTEKLHHIRAHIADRIGEGRFRTWFGDSTQLTLHGDHLDVAVENQFVSAWIYSNFLGHLVEATREVLGVEPQVDVRVAQKDPARTALPATRPPGPPVVPPEQRPIGRDGPGPAAPPLRGELDTFVVGPSNQLAYSAASRLAQSPGQSLRLLVLHSGCGLGKTHVLQGICNAVRRDHPALQWRYVSGEEFTNAFVQAVRTAHVDSFRARFRKVDLLVVDDIHFLANKKATQEEFLHTFNAVDAWGKAIVLSSDRHPRSIATLAEPLINRLISGMIVQIEPPDFHLRREILRRRALAMAVELPDDVLDFVARRVTRNVRALEGALYKLVALASLTREPFSLSLARQAVDDYIDAAALAPQVTDIERVVANYFGVARVAVNSKLRDRNTSLARALTMFLVRRHTQLSFPEIGRALGKKNHSTVLMAVRRIEHIVQQNGAVVWTTSSGTREAPLRDVLQQLEHDLLQTARASA